MATKFLDATGLKYAVGKIKTLIAAKQDKLTFDSKPTSGSTNPVTSGGVYDAINNGITPSITLSVEASAGSSTWIEVPTEDLYVGGTQPTAEHAIWLEVSE